VRHGHTSATRPDRDRPPNAYIREDQILPRLPALSILIGAPDPAPGRRKQGTAHATASIRAEGIISYLRAQGVALTYDQDEHTLRAGTHGPVPVTIDRTTPAARR
jgi:hypothetical protein